MKKLLVLLMLTIVFTSGCVTQETTTTTTVTKITTTTISTTTTTPCLQNCIGSAGLCKEYKCLEGTCIVITLSNCCGNGVCEEDETDGIIASCEKDCQSKIREINHSSCKEEGKIKVLVVGLIGSKPTFTDDLVNVLNEAIVGYPVELTVHRIDMNEAGNDFYVQEYLITGYPTTIIDCHYSFEGSRTVENFRTVFNSLLKIKK